MRTIPGIVVHHSGTHDGPDTANFHGIVAWHTEHNKWSDIGYHAVVEYVDREPVCFFGRPVTRFGSHALGHNGHLGICFVGNFNGLPPPGILVAEAVKRVLVPWCIVHNLTANDVRGHNELPGVSTDCPGHAFNMDKLRKELATCLT